MSRLTMGHVLLRNVIRHTDAHNKIQEESEMWKMRGWEKQTSQVTKIPDTEIQRGHMHCDRVSASSEQVRWKDSSGHDDRESRYWSRKLYEFEANDPDRWGHSGFKELYPEEFKSGSDSSSTRNSGHHRRKKHRAETDAPKRSKKSSRKKKRKKEEEKRRRAETTSSESDDGRGKKKKRTKSKHRKRKSRGEEEGEAGNVEMEGERERERERRTRCGKKKRKQVSHKDSDSDAQKKKKKRRRKNWKEGDEEERTDDSSEE